MADTKTPGVGERQSLEACTKTAVENARELFGGHPEDVISPLSTAANALGWLEEIFVTIKNEALNERNGLRIQKLAEAGAYLAVDFASYADSEYEGYRERLQTAGVTLSGEVSA